jgi:flagellar biosynthesis protein FlhF
MHIKSYFAQTVAAAVEQARNELGPEALIMNTREAPPEAAHLGKYEVVFGAERSGGARNEPSPERSAAPAWRELLRNEVQDLRRQMDELRKSRSAERPEVELPAGASDLHALLLEREIDGELAGVIVRSLQKRAGAMRAGPQPVGRSAATYDPAQLWGLLPAELESRLAVDAGLPLDREPPCAVALVGPPGAGKTTTLVKLALAYGLQARRPVQLLSLDTLRIGAAEQLRSYAAILGVGFQVLETTRALDQALEEHRHKGLVLIDTAGYSGAGLADAVELARHLAGHQRIETHLVLPASMKAADLTRALENFEMFRPSKLLFTRLDETRSYGSMYCASVRSGVPISFLTNGQSVPEDIEPATKGKLIDLILGERAGYAESAA